MYGIKAIFNQNNTLDKTTTIFPSGTAREEIMEKPHLFEQVRNLVFLPRMARPRTFFVNSRS